MGTNSSPFEIDAHRDGRLLAAFGLQFTSELSTAGYDFLRWGDDFGHLEGEPAPDVWNMRT